MANDDLNCLGAQGARLDNPTVASTAAGCLGDTQGWHYKLHDRDCSLLCLFEGEVWLGGGERWAWVNA